MAVESQVAVLEAAVAAEADSACRQDGAVPVSTGGIRTEQSEVSDHIKMAIVFFHKVVFVRFNFFSILLL